MFPPLAPKKHLGVPLDAKKQPPLDSSGRWRLSLGRDVTSPQDQAFLPSSEDLKKALRHLEVSGTGKVRESQVKMLLELSFGEGSAEEKMECLKQHCMVEGGRLELESAMAAIDKSFSEMTAAHIGEKVEKGVNTNMEGAVKESSSIASAVRKMPGRSSSRTPVRSKRGSGTKFDCLSEYVEAFLKFDFDNDGVISPSDLQHAVESLAGVTASLDDCKEAVAKIDAQQIGGVTLLEFRHLNDQLDALLAGGADGLL